MMLADMHVHSTYSDGKLTIPEIVDFFGSKGFRITAITDHLCEENSFFGKASRLLKKTLTKESFPFYLEEINREGVRAMERYGMMVIPGIELTKNSMIFHRSAHPVSTRFFEHQTYQLWDNRIELAGMFDAWEVASGPYLFKEVMESGLPLIANSDFHHPKQMRSWKTLIRCELNFESFKMAIKNQDIQFTFYEEAEQLELKNASNEVKWGTYA